MTDTRAPYAITAKAAARAAKAARRQALADAAAYIKQANHALRLNDEAALDAYVKGAIAVLERVRQ